MLLKPIPYALCINIFSEFYNHAEYGYAYETFKHSMQNFYNIQGKELEKALLYIDVHNEYQTEIHHFLAVINSLENYEKASGEVIDIDLIYSVGVDYLDNILKAFKSILDKFMQ